MVQRRPGAAAELQPGRAPEQFPRQRTAFRQRPRRVAAHVHRIRVQPPASQLAAVCRPGTRILRQPLLEPEQVQPRRIRLPGQWSPRPWAQTTVGYTFEDENGHITSNFAPGTDFASFSDTQRSALQQLRLCAGTARLEASLGTGRRRLRQQHQLRQQSSCPRVSGTFLLFRGNDTFSETRLRAGYAEGIKEPSFLQSFGISGTYPVLPNPEPSARAEQIVGSRLRSGILGQSPDRSPDCTTATSFTTRSSFIPTRSISPASTTTSTSRCRTARRWNCTAK